MITLVIPAYNEQNRLPDTVKAFANYFPKIDILIVPNGCTDNTETVAQELATKYNNVRTWATPTGGKGFAVREGFKRAKHDLVGFVDADLAITPEEFAKLLPFAKENDVVISSRWLKDSNVTQKEPAQVRFAGRIFNLMVRTWFGLKISDTQCGAKIFKTDLMRKILPKCIVNKMAFDVEFLYHAKNFGATIKEVPITWKHNPEESKTGVFKTGIKMIGQLASIRK
ncbi:MAG: glycosyltransferase [Candidatus Woesearchaeota archaeon]|jgi:dolichyl-phosphate beta-glucosyltransferase|nr:glycosyltransferase [Candidatus Woesearchaeota archaeon]MDP7181009.1 glycosyltransferase [Candidatus Woesearchaeota archaeon]MDP7198370.1 glycosyltransferase [Candidatus Woesearchaeota archaeon]MDP7467472.1 glycosyltransferase [Candidatus Woesearchaeota archaeon]